MYHIEVFAVLLVVPDMYPLKVITICVVYMSTAVIAKQCMDYDENVTMTDNKCCVRKDSIQKCPDGLTAYPGGVCYVLIKNQTFPPKCPYLNVLPFYMITSLIKKLNLQNEDIWIMAKRNDSANLGNYEWIERGERYGETIRDNIESSNFNIDNHCLIVKENVFIPTNCSSLHSSFCAYAYNTTQYCANNYEKGSCISSHFDFYNGNCYCNVKMEEPKSKVNQTCPILAEPKLQFQSHMLLDTFQNSDVCWFGLSKIDTCRFSWASTSEPVQYNYWSRNTNCNYYEGAISFAEDKGWLLLNDTSLNCSLCSVSIEPKQISLEVYHDLNADVLKLIIKNPLSISDWNGQTNLYCFSTTNTDDFKYKLNISLTKFNANLTTIVVNLPEIEQYPGHYWCSAHQFPQNEIVHSNTIVTYNKTNPYGYEYSLFITIRTFGDDPLLNQLHVKACRYIYKFLLKYQNIMTVRPLQVLNYNIAKETLEIIAHVTTKKLNQKHSEEYFALFRSLYLLNLTSSNFYITKFLSTIVCFSDFTVTKGGDLLEWPETNIGVTAIPSNQLCVDDMTDGLPVTRKCEGSFMFGAEWTNIEGTCLENAQYTQSTKELFYLLKLNTVEQGIDEVLAEITARGENTSVIDVHLISSILFKVATQNTKVNKDFLNTVENLMGFNRSLLNDSQGLLNSTDQVLFSLDDVLMRFDECLSYKSNNLIVELIDLRPIEAVTIILLNTSTYQSSNFSSYSTRILYDNDADALQIDSTFEVVIKISSNVLQNIKNQTNPQNPLKLVLAMFNNDFLFNQNGQGSKYYVGNKIVSITWIGFTGYLMWPIQIMFKKRVGNNDPSKCGYWDYGWDQLMISKYGRWVFDNATFTKISDVEFCQFYHTTHFGLLLLNSTSEVSNENEEYLRIIFSVGSALSLVGIVPIFLTAIFHKPWRSRPATKILIQLCITIVTQTCLLLLSDLVTGEGVVCKVLGAFTHYIVLAEFCWMFAIGLLQYRKFVVIMKPPPPNVLQISAIIGWGIPVIPVFITLAISIDNYGFINNQLCYIVEMYAFIFLIVPIIVMYIANVYIFVRIFYSIARVNSSSVVKVKNYKAEIFLAILLFFILGLTWIFAFIDIFGGGVVFTYLFSITSSIRGFVVFIFFIVRNKEVMHLWIQDTNVPFHRTSPLKDKRVSEITLDNSSQQSVN